LLVDRGVPDGVFWLLENFHFFEIYFSGWEIKGIPQGLKPQDSGELRDPRLKPWDT
jgi:hypothetical protein